MVQQKWRRVQHAQSLIKVFLERPSTIKAFEIIDTEGDVEFSVQNTKKREVIPHSPDDALSFGTDGAIQI
jgi:hypothetical protein